MTQNMKPDINGRCPICGAQCFDPFGWGELIHDINTCCGAIADRKAEEGEMKMITGNSERKIKQYLPIDRLAEGFGFVVPKDGEEFIGIPYPTPFIEVRKDGVVVRSINAIDVAEIDYEANSYDKLLIEWAENHYWDSLEKDKDLILQHLRTFGDKT